MATTRKKTPLPLALDAAIKAADKPSTLMAKTMPATPKRGRPVTTGTTPAKDRKAKSRAAAAQEGGERLHVMLTPEGARHLRQIMADNDVGKTEAVHIAMLSAHRWKQAQGLLQQCLDDEFGITSKALRTDIEKLLR